MKLSVFNLCLIALLAFTSCQKNDLLKDSDKEGIKDEIFEEGKEECFELVYPLTYNMPDGSEISGDDNEELWDSIKAWYEENPDSDEKPALQYPVVITYKDDISKTINNGEEMILAKKDCTDKDEFEKDCFELVYPVTYNMPDGSTVTGDDEETGTAIKAWYEENPDSEEKPALQYPVTIIYKDEISKAINNEEEMIWAKKDCDDKEYEKDCFKLAYPVTFNMPDGSIVTGDEEETGIAIKAWYEANPDSEEKPALQYPVVIIYKDEFSKTINNEEEMTWAKKDCYDKDDKELCFGLIYPLAYGMPDGSEISGEKAEIWDAIKAWYDENPDAAEKPALQYPVAIVFKDGTTQTINNETEMGTAKEECDYDEEEIGG